MKLYAKHGEQQTVIARADFTGGLNTAAQVDGIAENQFADVLNMEIDAATGKLQTVSGTVDVLENENIFAAMYDSINNLILLVKNDKQIFLADFEGNVSQETVGRLTGNLYPKYVSWENGIVIASGGNLQYFDGANLNLLNSSPFLTYNAKNQKVTQQITNAENVFVRDSRICFTSDTKIFYSGKGDENFWLDNANSESTAKWIEIGFKDGGKIKSVVSLANDILVIKDNKKIYRLVGEFPQWQIAEVASEINCNGRLSVCKVGEDIFVVKHKKVSRLDKGTFLDDGEKLNWKFLAQRIVSHHEFLLKRSRVSVTPLACETYSGHIFCGQVKIPLPIPDKTIQIYENHNKIFDNQTPIVKEGRNRGYILPQPPDGIIFRNAEMIYENHNKIFANNTYETICRNVFRNKYLDIGGRGEGGRFILQSIILDVTEV